MRFRLLKYTIISVYLAGLNGLGSPFDCHKTVSKLVSRPNSPRPATEYSPDEIIKEFGYIAEAEAYREYQRNQGFWNGTGLDNEDLAQEAYIELLRVYKKHKPEAGANLKSFLGICTRNRFRSLRTHFQRDMRRISPTSHRENPDDLPVFDLSEYDFTEIELLRKVVKALPEKRGTILRLYFYEGLNYPQIAIELGDSKQNVHITLKRTLDHLRDYFQREALTADQPSP